MNIYNDSLNKLSQRPMTSLGYDQTPYQEGKGLTYQGAYLGSYLAKPYIKNQHSFESVNLYRIQWSPKGLGHVMGVAGSTLNATAVNECTMQYEW